MNNIRNYSLVVENNPEALVKTVTDALKEGFQPIGGVCMVLIPASIVGPSKKEQLKFSQALVRLYTPEDALRTIVASAPKIINGS